MPGSQCGAYGGVCKRVYMVYVGLMQVTLNEFLHYMHIFRESTCTHRTCTTLPPLSSLLYASFQQWQPRRVLLHLEHAASTCSKQSAAAGRCSNACCSHCAACPRASAPWSGAASFQCLAGCLCHGREHLCAPLRILL